MSAPALRVLVVLTCAGHALLSAPTHASPPQFNPVLAFLLARRELLPLYRLIQDLAAKAIK